MKNLIITITCLLLTGATFAQQNKIITSGTIEYEKRINMHAVAKNMLNTTSSLSEIIRQAYDQYKANTPQFGVLKSTLIFNDNKSLFTPIAPEKPLNTFQTNPVTKQISTIYTDMTAHSTVTAKEIYGDQFLVKDSLRKITWRLTDETQDVAGYICRRANGLILDSVYVVAYYTDKIWMSSGPESFSGLPGMILKLAIPHENVIWTATKVSIDPVPVANIVPPKKGTVTTNKQLYDKLKQLFQNSGDVGKYLTRMYLL